MVVLPPGALANAAPPYPSRELRAEPFHQPVPFHCFGHLSFPRHLPLPLLLDELLPLLFSLLLLLLLFSLLLPLLLGPLPLLLGPLPLLLRSEAHTSELQ